MGLPEGADLGTTPISSPEKHYIQVNSKSELQANGTLKGTLTITAEGQSDGTVRGYFKNSNQTKWNQNIEQEFQRIHPKATITKLEYGNPMDYLSGPVKIVIDFSIPDYAVVSGKTLFFKPLMASPLFRSAQSQLYFETDLEKRDFAFRDRCSRQVEVNESIQIPTLNKALRVPEAVVHQGVAASINAGYILHGETLDFNESISLGKRIYEADEWPQFRAVVEAQNRLSDEMVVVELN
jgi:hypothetical protein